MNMSVPVSKSRSGREQGCSSGLAQRAYHCLSVGTSRLEHHFECTYDRPVRTQVHSEVVFGPPERCFLP